MLWHVEITNNLSVKCNNLFKMQMLNEMKNKGEPPAMDDLDDLVSS